MKKPKIYMAVAYNFINDNISCGYVGDVRTLPMWVELLFGEKGIEFFDGWTDKEIVNYIKQNTGYRLEVYK